MFGAPADVGFYKGVIYKTNEKKQAVCGHQGGLLWGPVREERETGRGTPAPLFWTEIIALLKLRGSLPATIEQTHWKVSRGYQRTLFEPQDDAQKAATCCSSCVTGGNGDSIHILQAVMAALLIWVFTLNTTRDRGFFLFSLECIISHIN